VPVAHDSTCNAVGAVDRQKVRHGGKNTSQRRRLSFSVCTGQAVAGICTHNQYFACHGRHFL